MRRRRPRIFVSVASYRDPFLPFTLESLLSRARYPERPGHAPLSDTSRVASKEVEHTKEDQQQMVLTLLRCRGGHTVHEAADALGYGDRISSIQPRFSELHIDLKLIEPSGERRKNRRSNKTATVWQLVSRG